MYPAGRDLPDQSEGLERMRSNLWSTSLSKAGPMVCRESWSSRQRAWLTEAWDAHGDELDEFKRLGETAYNVTEWDLSLANMSFSLGSLATFARHLVEAAGTFNSLVIIPGGEWTLEGWHYLLAHGGVIWVAWRFCSGVHDQFSADQIDL